MTQSDTMTEPATRPHAPFAAPVSGSRSGSANTQAADLADPEATTSPWHGIPAVLLDGTHSYDTDSAGGCG